MGKYSKNRPKFVAPIPITLSSEIYGFLPDLYPHNPVSWLYYGYKYISLWFKQVPQTAIPNVKVILDNGRFVVDDSSGSSGSTRLWDYGFFGKGTLSRSNSTWKSRTSRRLHLNQDPDHLELSNEEITKFRRQERIQFKLERAKEHELIIKRRNNTITAEETAQLAEINQILLLFRRSNKLQVQQELGVTIAKEDMRPEDQRIVGVGDIGDDIIDVEQVQLDDVETMFLKFIDVIDIYNGSKLLSTTELFHNLSNNNNEFITNYVVYHHYRSLGWCVRTGIKFGCTYLLYKKGPPFSHAEHAILIMQGNETLTMLQTVARVISSVRKNLVLVYVEEVVDNNDSNTTKNHNNNNSLEQTLTSYKVNEVVYRRWVPNKTRD